MTTEDVSVKVRQQRIVTCLFYRASYKYTYSVICLTAYLLLCLLPSFLTYLLTDLCNV